MPRLNRTIVEKIVMLSREAVLVADLRRPGFPVVFANPALERLAGIQSGAAEGQDWAFFLDSNAAAEQVQAISEGLSDGTGCADVLLPAANGSMLRLDLTLLPGGRQGRARYLLVQAGEEPEGALTATDAELAQLQNEMEQVPLATMALERRDPDSGMLHYASFLELCERDFALCSRQRREVAIVTFTIREFDVYRETFGDKSAQSCLRMVGGRISGALRRAGDLCARLDDGSFVALLTGHDEGQAVQFAGHIADQVRHLALHHPRASSERYVTCSIGVKVAVPDSQDRPEAFVAAAAAGMPKGMRAKSSAA